MTEAEFGFFVVRWATPVNCFQRTARNDVTLGAAQVRKGQRVGLF